MQAHCLFSLSMHRSALQWNSHTQFRGVVIGPDAHTGCESTSISIDLLRRCTGMASSEGFRAELVTFQCKECYVYRTPPASSIGHRAELWDVDHWLQVHSIYLFPLQTAHLLNACDPVGRKSALRLSPATKSASSSYLTSSQVAQSWYSSCRPEA